MKVAILALALFLSGCGAEVWEGFIYPRKTDLTVSFRIGQFDNRFACVDAARNVLAIQANGGEIRGDYECGLNCKPKNALWICDETVK